MLSSAELPTMPPATAIDEFSRMETALTETAERQSSMNDPWDLAEMPPAYTAPPSMVTSTVPDTERLATSARYT